MKSTVLNCIYGIYGMEIQKYTLFNGIYCIYGFDAPPEQNLNFKIMTAGYAMTAGYLMGVPSSHYFEIQILFRRGLKTINTIGCSYLPALGSSDGFRGCILRGDGAQRVPRSERTTVSIAMGGDGAQRLPRSERTTVAIAMGVSDTS